MNELEQYLASAAGKVRVEAGEEITASVDLVIAHDVTGPMAVERFQRIGVNQVFDQQKVVFVLDHIIPAATVEARSLHNSLRKFSRDFNT
ncbi:MAG: 3-isopropylmalate dehydratase large subunit, partial [Syntrophaceticus sp.]